MAAGLVLAACGDDGGSGGGNGSSDSGVTIGLLLPDSRASRWEKFDRPLIEGRVKQLCDNCRVRYGNARGDVAAQQQQVDSMITQGVDALILTPVDAKALTSSVKEVKAANIPVISYDRLSEGPISGYVSFDGEQVGRLQGTALLKALGPHAADRQIVMMNGDPSADPNANLFKRGALSVLRGKVRIGKSYDTEGWKPEVANNNMSGAIGSLGADHINGVYAANDGLAAGVIASLRANVVRPLPPVTGQDAELAAVQRIVVGDQYMTVYKPFAPEADAAAEMALTLGRGQKLGKKAPDRVNSPTTEDIPAVLLDGITVTVGNIRTTVVKDGMYTIGQICSPRFASACEKAGLTT
ncbi:substrate-binding domain-containing protein [Streptomyces sp. SID3212]|uniref:sugar ABC transporter substrate-binding protein n=1 Tax=Streptomyces sp. SID3212 TaxID=2690259 RepID=UPI00136D5AE8|nr:substrate-binding domain-containing protein [Streptomyces sp. SID3212]MYV52848.1 substrate-binding domain-containing protein [Streptomyces sp. SID3212]